MQKIITGTLVAATAVAALSACSGGDGAASNATGTTTAPATTTTIEVPATTTTQAPVITTTTQAPATPEYTVAQQNAIESAESYLDMSGFSRDGLIKQLSSEYGGQFTLEQATYAANQVGL